MKLLTEDYKVVEGRLLTEAEVTFINDVNAGIPGLVLYSHQKKEFITYMLEKYVLELKATKDDIMLGDPAEYDDTGGEIEHHYPEGIPGE
jgi:hypothetical protein